MKIILLGCGSIGLRHLNNLRALRPGVEVVLVDPTFMTDEKTHSFSHWRLAMDYNGDSDGVIIASPTAGHAEQIDSILTRGLPAYIEKPLTSVVDWTPTLREALLHYAPGLKVAVGYQYRFREPLPSAAVLKFYARDNLIDRYGQTVLETMGSHAIDRALCALGSARDVALFTDGRYLMGRVMHERGISEYDMRIDVGPRTSTINGAANDIDNGVYLAALGAWLIWIETGERDPRLATLADGVAVMDVMADCKMIETEKA